VKLKGRDALRLAARLTPFLLARGVPAHDDQGFAGYITGRKRKTADNKAFIRFHYDLSDDFYALFLDPEMVYSCAYFTDWGNGIADAQADKLEMICRKLRLQPGERLLDIGCGWGGLVCHAAKAHGVRAHGITLSENQLAYARAKVKGSGLEGRVTIELKDYSAMGGEFDKIASIGMYEHIGLKNIPAYMQKMQSLLSSRGARPGGAGSGRGCGRSSGRSPNTSFPAASSTTSGIRSLPWSAPGSRCRTWRPGGCTTRARASCGASGSPRSARRR
jgi:cyclopropane-fatty-acyl-phospholipid synthase